MKVSLYREMMKESKGYKFREYRCSGTKCNFKITALEGADIECNTPNCRGKSLPSFRVSNKKYVYTNMSRLIFDKGVYNPRFDPRIYMVSPTTRREIEKLVSLDGLKNTYPQITQKSVETTVR